MHAMKLLAVAIVCLIGAGVRAEDKVDYAKMLVGKWEVSKADEGTVPVGSTIEFTKDGKMKVGGKKDDAEMSFEGTYTVKDDTFTFKLKIGDNEAMDTITITKISKTEAVTKNKEGKVVELKKKS
jgi:uncharacterized protein (TIGR03066 family)